MKKIMMVMLVFLIVIVAVSAQDTSKLPTGSWVDENYNAVWTFSADNIVLSYTTGEVVFNFKDKMENFQINQGASGLEVSFKSEETGRSYKFVKSLNVTDTSVKMIIDKTNGMHYEVVMPMKK
jgi:hypothetical protein